MEIIRGHYNLKPHHHGCVATFGNFDGVHRGHRALLEQLRAAGRRLDLPVTVMTNEPLSREFFAPETAPPRLTRLREKLGQFAGLGIDRVLIQPFNRKLVAVPAETFVEQILVNGLGVRHLVIGDDTRFGRQRQGDYALLQRLGATFGFTVENTPTVLEHDSRVSSSRIRKALAAGDMATAADLLGRPYHMSGRVAHGEKRGRSLGFPTANIHINRRESPVMGIFAVRMHGVDDSPLPGVASIGYRPTFGGGQCLLEVHLFDFNRDIYRRHVDVEFVEKLREERRFDTVDALIKQMHRDAAQARSVLI